MKAYVLAGGRSSRMGTDKARRPLMGVAAAVVVVERLQQLGHAVTLLRHLPDGLPWIDSAGRPLRVLYEGQGVRHPLRGVRAALLDAEQDVLIVPCDLTDLDVATLERFRAPGVAMGTRRHPLLAVVPFRSLSRVESVLSQGGRALDATADLPAIEVHDSALRDVNRPDSPWPMDLIRERLSWVGDEAFRRLARAERSRQRARGVVDPSADRYAAAREDSR